MWDSPDQDHVSAYERKARCVHVITEKYCSLRKCLYRSSPLRPHSGLHWAARPAPQELANRVNTRATATLVCASPRLTRMSRQRGESVLRRSAFHHFLLVGETRWLGWEAYIISGYGKLLSIALQTLITSSYSEIDMLAKLFITISYFAAFISLKRGIS